MRWPRLVMDFTQSTPAEAVIELEGFDRDGAPIEGASWSGLVNWQDQSKRVYNRDRVEVEVTASLYIDGDIAPEVANITGGTVEAFGEEREIVHGTKGRNPDGTVNYTRLELR